MASQLEQLLTCCICLDRFRNPKLLPCQHSVCMEPCMEGLVDYVRRQVKCPECRAEHRIPYNGVQGFPSNVTLQRFLEAHIEITGEEPDPFTGQIMERCGVCNEKNYLSTCAHCDKKICTDCKAAHGDILKREIGRINNQVKRAVHRLSDQKIIIDRNMTSLKHNSDSVTEEIDNITKRLMKSIRDRGDYLRNEVTNYYNTEHRNLTILREGLEQEIINVEANIDLAEKHMDDQTPWDDCELMDTKDIFLRTMEFIRNFDYEAGDYNRRAKFIAPDDLNKLAVSLNGMGELIINNSKHTMDSYGAGSSSFSSGLMKSKSDHRLAVQFRDQEDSGYSYNSGRTSPITRRRFGDRPVINHEDSPYDSSSDIGGRRRFRSRFMRQEEEERATKLDDEPQKPPRVKVIDTEDVSRGPLSGILKMYDSPRVIQRLQEKLNPPKKKKEEPPLPTPVATPKPVTFGTPRKTVRQTSNDDEIDKIKKQNKVEATATKPSTITPKPTLERLSSLKDTERTTGRDWSSNSSSHSASHADDDSTSRNTNRDYSSNKYETSSTRKTSTDSSLTQKSLPFSRSPSNSSVNENSKLSVTKTKTNETHDHVTASRSNSTDSNRSTDGVVSPKKSSLHSKSVTKTTTPTSPSARGAGGASRYHSRFLTRPGTPSAEPSKESGNEDEDDDESSEESESEESEESSDEEEEEKDTTPSYSLAGRGTTTTKKDYTTTTPSANDSGYGSSGSSSRYGTSTFDSASSRKPSYLETTKTAAKEKEDEFESKYPYASKFLSRQKVTTQPQEETKTAFQSRFLNRSKSSAILGPEKTDKDDDTPTVGSSRARFEEMKERRQRLARSKSSAGMDEDEDKSTSTTDSASSYKPRYGRDSTSTTTTPVSSRLTNTTSTTSNENASEPNQLSNWARYLKNKYGNKNSTSNSSTGSSYTSSTTSAASNNDSGSSSTTSSTARALARSRSSHLLGMPKDNTTVEDDSKNECATPTSQAVGTLGPTPFGSIHRSQYLQKQKLLFKIGSRGSEPKNFTWPRGIAVGPDNSIVVADSSNHRVQVFDCDGNFIKMFGSYGNGEGEFDCLSGLAVNRIGQFIIADRYNHRIQIFDPSGMFLRTIGSQGSGDGKFSYPWGVTTDSLGFIYVCDKENHRVQVFQSDGTFVGKFGTLGNKVGQLEYPHYIAVSSTNRVIVSDSNNHRIQVFDINGKVLTSFGEEGSDEAQFKFPRGVAVDEEGYIFVADSGNNRIQIFNPEGVFIRAFGSWGSADGEFKGLEGVSVMSNGNILICDRENHRVQVF